MFLTPSPSSVEDKKRKFSDSNGSTNIERINSPIDTDKLRIYYQRIFPALEMVHWLCYRLDPDDARDGLSIDLSEIGTGQNSFMARREFSFTKLSPSGDEIYLRFLSFGRLEALKIALVEHNPIKIDIGAVYNVEVQRKSSCCGVFEPVEKEMVFDIDLTDYDDIRNCCSGANICRQCWHFMTLAIKIIDITLRDDFGFKNLLWVYSGRRGVHCWVCDATARKMRADARSAVAEYLHVVSGSDNQAKKVNLGRRCHPMISRAVRLLDDSEHGFERILVQQRMFCKGSPNCGKALRYFPGSSATSEKSLTAEVEEWMEKHHDFSSLEFWKKLKEATDDFSRRERNDATVALYENALREVMLAFCYPRLDINVSKGFNHLLKAPFCVHPKTGRVCVPIDASNAEAFDPLGVPTLNDLIEDCISEASVTSLTPHISFFRDCFIGPLRREAQALKKRTGINITIEYHHLVAYRKTMHSEPVIEMGKIEQAF